MEGKVYGSKASECTVVDCEDGTYSLSFTASVAGDYKLQVRFENQEIAPITMHIKEQEAAADAAEKQVEKDRRASRDASESGDSKRDS